MGTVGHRRVSNMALVVLRGVYQFVLREVRIQFFLDAFDLNRQHGQPIRLRNPQVDLYLGSMGLNECTSGLV